MVSESTSEIEPEKNNENEDEVKNEKTNENEIEKVEEGQTSEKLLNLVKDLANKRYSDEEAKDLIQKLSDQDRAEVHRLLIFHEKDQRHQAQAARTLGEEEAAEAKQLRQIQQAGSKENEEPIVASNFPQNSSSEKSESFLIRLIRFLFDIPDEKQDNVSAPKKSLDELAKDEEATLRKLEKEGAEWDAQVNLPTVERKVRTCQKNAANSEQAANKLNAALDTFNEATQSDSKQTDPVLTAMSEDTCNQAGTENLNDLPDLHDSINVDSSLEEEDELELGEKHKL